MASQIQSIIPEQSFEIIRDRIGLIVKEELREQFILRGIPTFKYEVFVERFAKIDRSENAVVNVTFASGALQNEDVVNSQWLYSFNIDGYTGATSTPATRGDSRSEMNLQRLMGVIRAILRDSRYKTLAFAPPFVLRRTVASIQIATPDEFKDTLNMTMGRVVVNVLVSENEGTPEPLNIAGWTSIVKLAETDLGYVFTEYPDPA